MITQDANFISGFVKQCFDQGMTEDETVLLFDTASSREELKDPDFYEGFKQACDKHASADGKLNPFSVMNPTLKSVGTGSILGSGLGLLGGAAALRKGRVGSAKKLLTRTTGAGAGIGGVAGAAHNKLQDWKERISRPDEWAPDYLVPGQDSSAGQTTGAPSGSGNAFSGMTGFAGMDRATNTGGQTQNTVQPVAMGQQVAKEIDSLDKQIETLRGGMTSGGELSGSLSNRRIQSQIEKLEDEKDGLMRTLGNTYNSVRRDQARSGTSIAQRLRAVEQEIESRSGRAGDAAAWLEATRSGRGLGALSGRLWNKLVGAESSASGLSYELERLRDERQRLLDLQSRVGGML